ncbi:MAG: type II toxin-antitoxin system RelE/ParE family toxin, partial [Clostridia bacterium]|nr:type II toxin-antitoxin system RelE/ParE family toxin [Clostridia bacterium]
MATVILSTKAEGDLGKIKTFYGNLGASPLAIKRILEGILYEIAALETFPEAGHEPDDPYLKSRGYLCFVIYEGRYIVFYVFDEEEQIVRIRRILPTRNEYL